MSGCRAELRCVGAEAAQASSMSLWFGRSGGEALMPAYEHTLENARPAAGVFTFVTRPRNYPLWLLGEAGE